ncbi:hypothetical protein PF002_g19696 [Phytophthora fragariae]|uniref:Uncharacterized protein n=1 Tax=Phytophthora fragariae TaxID=53985 RepID=A0A6A3XSB8_9STRA|nr:hypothetical protein PF007_g7245 [Phytophthora fragariae]KAE9207472.1 hypothetical protein PF002_g19696 [Phytophthora fragariae]KAE9294073.1 hypothetical protein PF001_g17957 [Phytophthora fragariae]
MKGISSLVSHSTLTQRRVRKSSQCGSRHKLRKPPRVLVLPSLPSTSVRVGPDRCSLLSDITAQQRQALLRLPVAREAPNPAFRLG